MEKQLEEVELQAKILPSHRFSLKSSSRRGAESRKGENRIEIRAEAPTNVGKELASELKHIRLSIAPTPAAPCPTNHASFPSPAEVTTLAAADHITESSGSQLSADEAGHPVSFELDIQPFYPPTVQLRPLPRQTADRTAFNSLCLASTLILTMQH